MKVLLRIAAIIWTVVILTGCKSITSPFLMELKVSAEDTAFDESERDWVEVYRYEIKSAVENEDVNAYNFFFQEYMKERVRQFKEKAKNEEE